MVTLPPPGSLTPWAGRHVANARAWMEQQTAWPTTCPRCDRPIYPTMRWHLGHKRDRQAYPQLAWEPSNWQVEHQRCSTSAGATQGNRRRRITGVSSEQNMVRAAPSVLSLPDTTRGIGWVPPVAVGSFPDWIPSPPDDQVMPRLLTAPHPRAVGSYGPEQLEWARERFGMHPKRTEEHRYWQSLLACVALQHDDAGDLVYPTVQLGTARQSGKSWSLRELSMWRLEQGQRWGELQTVVHAAAKLSQAEAVWAPAARWAAKQRAAARLVPAAQPGLFDVAWSEAAQDTGPRVYDVRRANGSAMIVRKDDDSAWIPQAAGDQLGVSLSVSMGLVDEAWDVARDHVDNGLVPTMAEARSSQLWLVSTAGRPKTGEVSDLYPVYRATALDQLGAPLDHLIVEWSADPDADPGDPATWRQASPHWSEQRRSVLEREWAKAQRSAKALAAFRMQWLNQWPDLQDVARWLPSRITQAAARPVGDPPSHAVAAIESAASDTARYAVALAWMAGARVHVYLVTDVSLGRALELAGEYRTIWAHAAVAETIGPHRWGVERVTTVQARAATTVLKKLMRDGGIHISGLPDEQWAGVRTSESEGGEILDGRKSTGDIHGVKAAAWAAWAVESGRSHSGFLFGVGPDDAQPGAQTA